MKRSDGIENTGGIAPQTPDIPALDTLIEGGITAGAFFTDDKTQTEAQEPGDNKEDKDVTAGGIPETNRKPNLTPEQQEWLNRVFIPNFRRELMKSLNKEHFRRQEPAKEGGKESKPEPAEKASAVTAQTAEERDRLIGIITDLKISREIETSAQRHNAIKPSQVAQLLRHAVRLDKDFQPVVLDESGEPAIGAEGNLRSIEEMVRDFMAENPHMTRPAGNTSGSGTAKSTANTVFTEITTGGDLIKEGLIEEKNAHGKRLWKP